MRPRALAYDSSPLAITTYETLRAAVLIGQARPDGLGAVVYHGMLHGLEVMLSAAAPRVSSSHEPQTPIVRHDRDLVHLMANIMLNAQSEVRHVY